MTEQQKGSTGTPWIIVGAILLAIGFVQAITAPMVIAGANGDGATIAGKIVGVILFVGFGAWALVAGLNQRRQSRLTTDHT